MGWVEEEWRSGRGGEGVNVSRVGLDEVELEAVGAKGGVEVSMGEDLDASDSSCMRACVRVEKS